MQPDTGAISLLMLAAALLIGVLGVSERALSHTNLVEPRYAEWQQPAD
jgi:hypothetical protein